MASASLTFPSNKYLFSGYVDGSNVSGKQLTVPVFLEYYCYLNDVQ